MRNSKTAPKNPETEVTKEDIAQMAGCSITKVNLAAMNPKWGLPKMVRRGPMGKVFHSKAEVIAWLEKNDLKNIVFYAEDRRKTGSVKAEKKQISSTEFARLPIGTRPRIKFNGTGTSPRVHVPAQHGYEKPHSALTKASHNAEHRLSGLFNL